MGGNHRRATPDGRAPLPSARGERAHKPAAVRAAARHDFPTADIEQMLDEIKDGYLGR